MIICTVLLMPTELIGFRSITGNEKGLFELPE